MIAPPPTEARILDAAEQCFGTLGLRRVSMGDVARRAGVSRGSVYRYFPDRDSLLDSVLERAADRFVADSEPTVRRRRTLAAQVAEAAVFVRLHHRDARLTLPFHAEEESLLATLLATRVERLVARWVGFWQPYLADAQERGEIRADLDRPQAAEWIVRVLVSLTFMPSTVVDLDDPEAIRKFVQSFVVRGFAP